MNDSEIRDLVRKEGCSTGFSVMLIGATIAFLTYCTIKDLNEHEKRIEALEKRLEQVEKK